MARQEDGDMDGPIMLGCVTVAGGGAAVTACRVDDVRQSPRLLRPSAPPNPGECIHPQPARRCRLHSLDLITELCPASRNKINMQNVRSALDDFSDFRGQHSQQFTQRQMASPHGARRLRVRGLHGSRWSWELKSH
ncbi:unnamed protein product [Pleuronectes platessa]|uniref:Uncharacterized protein n=1 Tax=Pleuronectes platessa TaxID=8262 RepID=A0A9N7ZDS6_PLEPL|nr:unnamed protein product [Pleuronectes platessa]